MWGGMKDPGGKARGELGKALKSATGMADWRGDSLEMRLEKQAEERLCSGMQVLTGSGKRSQNFNCIK